MKKLLFLFLFVFMVTGCIASPITVQVANDVSGNVEQDIGDSTTVTNPPQSSYQPEVENGRWIWGGLFLLVIFFGIAYVMNRGIESATTKEEYYDKQWKP